MGRYRYLMQFLWANRLDKYEMMRRRAQVGTLRSDKIVTITL